MAIANKDLNASTDNSSSISNRSIQIKDRTGTWARARKMTAMNLA